MSQDYEIISWDGIISQNDMPLASVTIKPDRKFITQFLNNTNNKIQIQISGTNSQYDNVWMALVDTSAVTPNCRKNFYDATQYWILTLLNSSWQGPPSAHGTVSILDGPYQVYQNYYQKLNRLRNVNEARNQQRKEENIIPSCCDESSNEIDKSSNDNNNKLMIYSAGILLLLSIILLTIYLFQKRD